MKSENGEMFEECFASNDEHSHAQIKKNEFKLSKSLRKLDRVYFSCQNLKIAK